ncbi:MAG: aminotransferase class V-fold PLP-dependent enzyme [Phycisphaerales bacterium JB043]
MLTRRETMALGGLGLLAASGGALNPLTAREAMAQANARRGRPERDDPARAAMDEGFWSHVARAFDIDRSITNLNNGGVSPTVRYSLDALHRHLDASNHAPPYTMWKILEPRKETARQQLAEMFGCDSEEIAITRGASESLQTCQLGIDLREGDEIVTTTQDYPRMLTTFRQRQAREGITLKQFEIPVVARGDDEIVSRFEAAITPSTRLVLMSHCVNISGQILPVRPVAELCRARGVPMIVDGAHSFAQFHFTQEDLGCDYFGTSLHKWLFAPIGTGMLYVKKDRIGDLWPLMASNESQRNDIRKFEEIGTHPAAQFLAISEAITFNHTLGLARKNARFRYLRDRWARHLMQHERVRVHTDLDARFSGPIATVQLEGIDSGQLSSWLFKSFRILVTPIQHEQFEGIRVSPSVYTTVQEIDRFVEAMEHALAHGIEDR